MSSIWSNDISMNDYPSLKGDFETDVLIIGGGLTGVLLAYFLESLNINYILVEKDSIGMGVTKNTTAKITPQHNLIYNDILCKYGKTKAKNYYLANLQALQKFEQLASNIDCDFTKTPSYVYSLNNTDKIKNEYTALKYLDINSEITSKTTLPLDVKMAIKMNEGAPFHPLKFLKG